jgi:hypothetical protein
LLEEVKKGRATLDDLMLEIGERARIERQRDELQAKYDAAVRRETKARTAVRRETRNQPRNRERSPPPRRAQGPWQPWEPLGPLGPRGPLDLPDTTPQSLVVYESGGGSEIRTSHPNTIHLPDMSGPDVVEDTRLADGARRFMEQHGARQTLSAPALGKRGRNTRNTAGTSAGAGAMVLHGGGGGATEEHGRNRKLFRTTLSESGVKRSLDTGSTGSTTELTDWTKALVPYEGSYSTQEEPGKKRRLRY